MRYLSLLLALSLSAADLRAIDRGSFHSATIDSPWPRGNVTYKGLAVKLMHDGEIAGGICYDTDLLRMSSAWTGGFLRLQKDVMSTRDFRQTRPDGETVGATRRLPGPAIPDPRPRPFGPLPAEIAKYRGLYVNGDDVVLHYSLGPAHLLEHPAFENGAVTRTIHCDNPGPAILLCLGARPQNSNNRELRTDTDHTPSNGAWLSMGFASSNDYLSRKRKLCEIRSDGLPVSKLIDGNGGQYDIDERRVVQLKEPTTIIIDLRTPQKIRSIDSFSWHRDSYSAQAYTLFASLNEEDWTSLASVDTRKHGAGGIHGVSTHAGGGSIGEYRYLKFAFTSQTWLSEIDVHVVEDPPKFQTLPSDPGLKVIGDAKLELTDTEFLLRIPPGESLTKIAMFTGFPSAPSFSPPRELERHCSGGPRRWNQALTTTAERGEDKGPYTRDDIPLPLDNPWKAWFRPGGFDFYPDGDRAALCNIDGDVWTVTGLKEFGQLRWQRVATGLFQALGLTIRGNNIYVLGRDQITKLHDLNGDGETDFYENFNNDVETTWNFHEFAFDLQTDRFGNFYYAKGAPVRNGGRGFDTIAAHHGAIVQVSPDGKSSRVFASGLRAPNGISVRADGQVTSGDNEGSWMPKCRLNLIRKGGFYGVVPTAHRDTPPTHYDPPICWLPKAVDNSGGGQAWVTSDQWGPYKGDLLHLSYGTSMLYHVMHETPGGIPQGGVWRIPVKLPSSAMRARFSSADGQLYICGLRGWQTNAAKDGHSSRIRYTGQAATLPKSMHVKPDGIAITFTAPLDREEAEDPEAYAISQWNYSWTEAYGSRDYSVAKPGEEGQDDLAISAASLSGDGRTVHLKFPVQAVDQMRITIDLLDANGDEVITEIHNTINVVPEE